MKKIIAVAAAAIAVAGIAVYLYTQQQEKKRLAAANAVLQAKADENARLKAELENRKQTPEAPATKPATNDTEVLRLRGEVGRLRQDVREAAAAKTNTPSALSGLTSNPEMFKTIRNQQKMGMSMIYQGLTNRVNLSSDQVGKLNDLLADNVMENIDHITEVIRDGKTGAALDAVFAAQDAALREKVRTLLGDDALWQYDDYTKNLASFITAEQFKAKLSGEKAERDLKGSQFYDLLRAEARQVLSEAGLADDYQLVPTMNFSNFASETIANRNLNLLDKVYERAAGRAGSIFSADDLAKFT